MDFMQLDWQGKTLAGSIDVPAGATQGLLLLHGFTGNRLEFTYFFVELSRRLAERGIATFRFDFPGCGESDGEFADITLAQQALVTRFLLRELAARYPQLGWHLFGFSMGGRAAMLAAQELPVPLRSLSLAAPALNLASVVAQAAAQGERLPDGRSDFLGMEIGLALVNELTQLDPLAGLHTLRLPVLIVHGGADAAVPPQETLPLQAAIPHALREEWPGVDHTFSRRPWRMRLADRLAQWVELHAAE